MPHTTCSSTSADLSVARARRVPRRLALLLLLLLLAASLSACDTLATLTATPATQTDAGPNLDLLTLPPYTGTTTAQTTADVAGGALMPVDLWLDGTQNMGGINANTLSMYPHYGKKYREGGFQYHNGNQAGWYQSLLGDFLSAAGEARVRTLRYGNETMPAAMLATYGLAGADDAAVSSLWRDMHTVAVPTNAGLFAQMAAEDMTQTFYTLGSTAWLNRMTALDTQLLENPTLAGAMSEALDAQAAAIAAGEAACVLAPGRDGQGCALLAALPHLDASRLSVITIDPTSLRKTSGVDAQGNPIAYYEQLLRDAGVFDQGLCVGVMRFTLDYMGQLSTIGNATLSEPLVWGRIILDEKKQTFENEGVMPRQMITLVIGTRAKVDTYLQALTAAIEGDRALKGLRGPEDGELTYTADGQTVTQQPFSFAWNQTVIARPGMGFYDQSTAGVTLTDAAADAIAQENAGLSRLTVPTGTDTTTLTVRFPIAQSADGTTLDVSALTGAGIKALSSVVLTQTLPNNPANRTATAAKQTIAYRDKLYVFTTGQQGEAFTLSGITQEGDTLVCAVTVDQAKLLPGYYRLQVSADVTAAQISWESIPWIDGSQSQSATITDADVYAWETFAAAITQYDRDAKGLPKMFQHAWGPYTEKLYHGLRVPDCPPVYKAISLTSLVDQLHAAAASDTSPLIRYAFEVFVPTP